MATRPGFIWSGTEWVAIGQEAIVNPFYYQATAPTTPSTGDIWIESDVDVPSVDSAQFLRWRKTMTGGETSLSGNDDSSLPLGYTPGYEQLYINGVLMVRGVDYTATTGTTVTALTALVADDVVEVFSTLARTVADVYTQTQSDAKYAPIAIGEVVTSRSTTTQVGGASANAIGNSSITLTPGTWLVQALASIFMASNTDAVSCGIWNSTGSVEVSASRGNIGTASTTTAQGVVSMQVVITVTSNTVYAPYLCRNGASTLQTSAAAGGAANAITALRIR
jgi:hypothetical protein